MTNFTLAVISVWQFKKKKSDTNLWIFNFLSHQPGFVVGALVELRFRRASLWMLPLMLGSRITVFSLCNSNLPSGTSEISFPVKSRRHQSYSDGGKISITSCGLNISLKKDAGVFSALSVAFQNIENLTFGLCVLC